MAKQNKSYLVNWSCDTPNTAFPITGSTTVKDCPSQDDAENQARADAEKKHGELTGFAVHGVHAK